MKKLYKIILFLLLISLLVPIQALAQYKNKIPEKPEVQSSVYDYGFMMKAGEKEALEEKLLRYSDSTSTQIVVVTVVSLYGEKIKELTPRWAQEWGIGQADKDNGVLILMSNSDREIWIAPGYGVDDKLTAGVLGQMIRDVIVPEFKEGNYYSGLDKGADAIFRILEGKYKEERPPESDDYTLLDYIAFFLIAFILGGGLMVLLLNLKGMGSTSGISNDEDDYADDNSNWDRDILSRKSSFSGRRSSRSDSSGGSSSSSSSGSSSRSGFRGGFGGGGFSGGGAGGSW